MLIDGLKPLYCSADARIQLFCGDAREITPRMQREHGESVTCWSDPPYSEHVHAKAKTGKRDRGLWSGDGRRVSTNRSNDFEFDHLTPELQDFLAAEAARLSTRWAAFFCDEFLTHSWRITMEKYKLRYARQLVWHKLGAAPQFTGREAANHVEYIVVCRAIEGNIIWNGGGKGNVYAAPICLARGGSDKEARENKTQKPEKLYQDLLHDWWHPTDSDELWLDFTAGFATLGVVCAQLGRRYIGIEIRQSEAEKAAARLEAAERNTTYRAVRTGRANGSAWRLKQTGLSF